MTFTVPSTSLGSRLTPSPGVGSATGLKSTSQPSWVFQSTELLETPAIGGIDLGQGLRDQGGAGTEVGP